MGRRGLHLDGIIYTDCPLKLALSTGIYNTSKRTSQIKVCFSYTGTCARLLPVPVYMRSADRRIWMCLNIYMLV